MPDATAADGEDVVRFCTPGRPPRLRRRDEALLDRATPLGVEVAGRQIRAYSWGAGPVVLLVHGWASCAAHLAAFVDPLLAAGHRVIAPDMPAHGRSPGEVSSFYKFERTLWALQDLAGPPAGVIAHSGGAVATTMAVANGLSVPRAVYLAPMVRLHSGALRFAAASGLDPARTAAFLDGMRGRFGDDLWERTAVDRLVADLDMAALLVHDRADPEVAHDEVADLARGWPEASLVSTHGLGHHRILRHRDTVERALAFLTRTPPPAEPG